MQFRCPAVHNSLGMRRVIPALLAAPSSRQRAPLAIRSLAATAAEEASVSDVAEKGQAVEQRSEECRHLMTTH